jgi:hypothetical protein
MKYLHYYIFFVVVILLFSYINSMHHPEGFTPAIRQFYRPYVRNARVYSEKMYNKYVNPFTNSLRKRGIL